MTISHRETNLFLILVEVSLQRQQLIMLIIIINGYKLNVILK
ncbi:Uncharacterised protein [Yersinia aldovae]|uniref:Uncharacterized protein n=1 Tax=Yersinia aldovae TaxID=29483 RepID=A0ABM9SWV5_YERAL|nr:Uncharacterised protein [Yersinia aldovae]